MGFVFCFLYVLNLALSPAQAAQVSTTGTAKVLKTIALAKNADLDFGEGIQGDASKALAPTATGAAAFTVTGTASHTYVIVLPTTAILTRSGGTETISITSFVHNAGATPAIGSLGTSTFNVGATRAALPATQVAGTYVGSFQVTVTY